MSSLRVTTFLGVALILYAGYSYRNQKLVSASLDLEEESSIKFETIALIVAGFFLVLISQLYSLKIKQIKISPSIRSKSYNETIQTREFITFNSRGSKIAKLINPTN